jgi:hypothetical protein
VAGLPESNFALGDADLLAHALTAQVARANGIRVVSIKGPVADAYELRAPRAAADADVWVDPARFDEFVALMNAEGWHARVAREPPLLMQQHSATLIHDQWPCDLDVHAYFPGFFGDRQVIFDALWARRAVLALAHQPVTVPSRAGAAVIAALHALRYTESIRHASELADVQEAILGFSASERAEFYDLARIGRALWVLRDSIAALGLGTAVVDATAEERRIWALNRKTVEFGAATSWLMALRSAPWGRKPGLLYRALWIPRRDIPRNDPEVLPTHRQAWAHRMKRTRRGARGLVRYFRVRRDV